MDMVDKSRLLRPEPYEPERSFFPKEKTKVIDFMDVMDQKLQMPFNGDRRNFRQYNLTFSLGHLQGGLKGFNFRMRCFVHPLPHGKIEFSNWQFTVKSNGHGSDRLEYETDDNLMSPDINQASSVLRNKYGDNIPEEVFSLAPDQFFVRSIVMNSRIGRNGAFQFEDKPFGQLDGLLSYNSDDVLFAHPNLISDGQVMITGRRPETEFEFKNLLMPDGVDISNITSEVKKSIFIRACDALYNDIRPIMGDIDEEDHRNKVEAGDYQLELNREWSNVASIRAFKPQDYLQGSLREGIIALVDSVESPYERPTLEKRSRAQIIQRMRVRGHTSRPMTGYALNLMAA